MQLHSHTFLCLSSLICVWSGLAETKLYGLHSDELLSGELVVPKKVDKYGEFITHNLTHHHKQHYHSPRQRIHSHEEVHYHLSINNSTLHLELEPHSYFLTPHLVIERHRRELRTRKQPVHSTNCHFHGNVRGHAESRVAISTCDGLVGYIRTEDNEYYIEPSKYYGPHQTDGHPHVVFHRSSVKKKKQITSRKKKRQKKLGRLQRGPYQAKHLHNKISNCGTKEPRERTETKLEWQSRGKVKIQGGRNIRRHNHQRSHSNRRRYQWQPQTKFKYETTEDIATATTTNLARDQHEISIGMGDTASGSVEASAPASVPAAVTTHERSKRSISSPRHVETLIVADPTMVAFHNDVETYLLTIMNMVSALYKDPSIGNSIEVVVVKIILLEEDGAHLNFNLTQNAQKNLDMFCSWQHKLNAISEKDPHHHDVAILITRRNICGNNCMTLGLANVGGMCKPKQSCSVNEDNGIMLSHTIAHELGHNFGMFHDTAKIGCHPRVGPIVHIMTPTFGADTLQVSWSNCSRKYITHFLDQGLGECLDDRPTALNQYVYPEVPPGVLYNAELQCRLQFNLTECDGCVCSSMNEICSTLWCRVNGECVTNMRPTAPGTHCGKRKWCQNGKCVRMEEVTPVDGGWGNWSEWSACSRSCGGGVSIQERECDRPVPANGGLFCIGERKRYKICKKQACPQGEPSFRAKQCSTHNNVLYQGGTYKWVPFFDKKNPCKLYCTDVDDTIIANWGDIVIDGTPCTLGTNDMCIDGICKKVGCDWIIDSELQEDRCGVCGGSGNKCKPVKEIFNETFHVSEGYVEIVTIPAKARHIIIKELGRSPHFLGIAKANTSTFYLNGDNLISMPGEFVIAGAESLYDRVDEQETIKIPQPIEHSISIYVILRGNEPNEGIYYEFTLPVVKVNSSEQYLWTLSNWTSCSTSCGGGVQYQEPLCHENGYLISNSQLCWSYSQNSRPVRQTRSCNENECPTYWWTGPWQFCPVTCRAPNSPMPVRRRSVMCLAQNEVLVADKMCNATVRPPDTKYCDQDLPVCATSPNTELVRLKSL